MYEAHLGCTISLPGFTRVPLSDTLVVPILNCESAFQYIAERVLHIDHLFARMQRLNTYEAKTNAMTRIGSNLSQVLPPPFS